ncbi:MAG: DUF3108 domain-containing protein [Bacteroidales bacterium]|nr:DUF3108 domain-containing protein [Bacteroidales bacterium]
MAADDGLSHVSEGAACIPLRTELKEENLAYGAGEHFTFTVHYSWGIINSDVGVADIDLDTLRLDGRKAFRCKVYGRTWRWYDKIFRVREDFRSWFTVDGLKPLKFTRNTREGKYIATNTYNYIWEGTEDPFIEADVYSSHSGQRNLELPLNDCTFDLPALFYLARNMDFDNIEPDVQYPMTFAIDDDVYNVYFILKDREQLKIKGLGKINTIRFAAKLIAGTVFTGDEDMLIWVTDDDNRVPVYFEAPILVGTASGRLAGYSGLKYEFSSLVTK